MSLKSLTLTALFFALLSGILAAHPIPDVPVRAFFLPDGSAKIRIEVDTRCWEEDPKGTAYLFNATLEEMSDAEKQKLINSAQSYIKETIEFHWEPVGQFEPEFTFEFRTLEDKPLTDSQDPVVLVGEWKTELDPKADAYFIKAIRDGKLSVKFLNHYGETPLDRINVLFPGETSFKLDITDLPAKVNEAKQAAANHEAVGA